ncbi:MAG TPA: hypothetical protein VK171_00080 [Fimbriimonas sp.]|nr:hypothetical protein [Fimbriimonas sp.]
MPVLTLLASLSFAAPLKVGMVGHSLLNHDIPQMLRAIAASKGKSIVVYEQIINGSPLSNNWKNSASSEKHPENLYGDLRAEISKSKPPFDVVVLTERVAIAECIRWEDTVGNLVNWRNHTLKFNPSAKVMFYSTWVGMHEGEWWKDIPDLPTWKKRTLADGLLFAKSAADATKDPRSTKGAPIKLVPGHTAMGLLYDELESGKLPWLGKNIRAAMADGIHLNKTGNYYIACVMYSSLFGESPVGATGAVKGIWGGSLVNVPANHAQQLQRLAWQAVSASK